MDENTLSFGEDASDASVMDALDAALASSEPEKTTPEPQAEPAKGPEEAKTTETEPGAVETQQEPPQAESEEELPEGVKKRIAREAEKQARIQSEIDRAVSNRKAKEEELKKLAGESGPQPVKTAPPADGKPARPNIETFEGTLAEYNAAVADYEGKYEAWLHSETTKRVEQEFLTRQAAEEGKRAWNEAAAKHAELPEATKVVLDGSTPDFQVALSSLENWPGVTVHLGKHPEELSAVVEKFKANPVSAIADLGALQERLKQAPTQAKTEKQPEKMPAAPPKRVGGQASVSTPRLNLESSSDVDNASDEELLSALGPLLKKAG